MSAAPRLARRQTRLTYVTVFTLTLLGAVGIVAYRRADSVPPGTLRVVLLGDSTTQGSEPRWANPSGPHLEAMIASALAAETDLPPIQVVNQGLDDESIQRLLESGRYAREIARLSRIDYAIVRYGINDSIRRRDFDVNFPRDYHALVDRLRADFPGVRIVLSTTTPFRSPGQDAQITRAIREVAAAAGLPLIDLYARYSAELTHDPKALSYRRVPVAAIPEGQRGVVAPFVHDGFVVVLDGQLDHLFGAVPGWFDDRHPNLAGYRVIADETAAFLARQIRTDRAESARRRASRST